MVFAFRHHFMAIGLELHVWMHLTHRAISAPETFPAITLMNKYQQPRAGP